MGVNYKSYSLGEDIHNLDICFIDEYGKLLKVRRPFEYNRELVLVNNIVNSDDLDINGLGYEDIFLAKGTLVRATSIVIYPKIQMNL